MTILFFFVRRFSRFSYFFEALKIAFLARAEFVRVAGQKNPQ
jgi:hypothetical protein